jgi:hypothetical protein
MTTPEGVHHQPAGRQDHSAHPAESATLKLQLGNKLF